MVKKTFNSIFLLLLVIFVTACSQDSDSKGNENKDASKENKPLIIGITNSPVNFHPINEPEATSRFVVGFMSDTLLDQDDNLEFVPKLAKSFETEDNQNYTITLHEDAKWSDGEPVTADDIIFTFNLAVDPKVEVSIGSYLSILDGVDANGKLEGEQDTLPSLEKIDEQTLTLKTKVPVDPNMLKEQLGTKVFFLPEHVLKDVPKEDLGQHEYMHRPTVTNGPFKFESYKKDQNIHFVANENYYRGAPTISDLYLKIVPSTQLTAQLQTGEIHMNAPGNLGKIPVQDYKLVEGLDNVRTEITPTIGIQTLVINHETVPNKEIRQAQLMELIDSI